MWRPVCISPWMGTLKHLIPVVCHMAATAALSQTVIINEVSNGPSGNKEYVELLVVPDGSAPSCASPPCLDLRGWLIDDNNGHHGGGGVATGAARFAQHPLWSCVPVGTLILIHNGADPNPAVPVEDVSLTDGNCAIVVSANDLAYFEYTNTTPEPLFCSYPATGWGSDPTPTWLSNLALANTGDCFRIAGTDGCEVFSFCYGNVLQNATVAIGGNGTNRVWWFNGGDPTIATNWSFGCAGNIPACGADLQTPGLPNSAENAAWIAQFSSNGCLPAQGPIEISASGSPTCGCDGSAEAWATGSIEPYTFEWYDALWTTLPMTTPAVTGLCAGIYHVVVTSSSGCRDTADVSIPQETPPDAGIGAVVELCPDVPPVDLFTFLGGTPATNGTWSPATMLGGGTFDPSQDPSGTYTYVVPGSAVCPDASASISVTVGASPFVDVLVTDATCHGISDGSVVLSSPGGGPVTTTWDDGAEGLHRTGLAAGSYTAMVTSPMGCVSVVNAVVEEPTALEAGTSVISAICEGASGQACVAVAGGSPPYQVDWNDPGEQTGTCANGLPPGSYQATVTDHNGCKSTTSVIVPNDEVPIIVTFDISPITCTGDSNGAIEALAGPTGDHFFSWSGPDGFVAHGPSISELGPGTYAVTISNGPGCTVTKEVLLNGPPPLWHEMALTPTSCKGACDGGITVHGGGGTPPLAHGIAGHGTGTGFDDLCEGTYTVFTTDHNGCRTEQQVEIQAGPSVITPLLTAVPGVCLTDDLLMLEANPGGGVWTGPGIVDPSGSFDPASAGPGTHAISYLGPAPCGTQETLPLTVWPGPNADIDIRSVDGPGFIAAHVDHLVIMTNWWVDGVFAGTGPELVSGWPTEERAEVEVCMTIGDTNGCRDTICRTIHPPEETPVYVPNAFTPDGDGVNDRFGTVFQGRLPEMFELLIFDRWGHVVHATRDVHRTWDGTRDGRPATQGVYPWVLRYAFPGEDDMTLRGHVTLVR